MQRRRHNAITALKDDSGSWCNDDEVLKSMAVSFYEKLFTSMGSEIEEYAIQGDFKPLPSGASSDVTRLVSVEEIEHVIRSMGPFKAPASMVDGAGHWRWDELDDLLPEDVIFRLMATKPPLADDGNDTLGWKWSENHHFSVRSAYAMGDLRHFNSMFLLIHIVRSGALPLLVG
ncbi:hypothetical protein V6N13_082841 [Hibiscus sabdariffa]